MLRYTDTQVVFREVPGEITLAVNISGCPVRCPECHSKWLWEDRGLELTEEKLRLLVSANRGVSCVALMGGDAHPKETVRLLASVKARFPELKTCWYSGRSLVRDRLFLADCPPDYLKVGPFDPAYGPLDSPNTNQRMYRITRKEDGAYDYEDITRKFLPWGGNVV